MKRTISMLLAVAFAALSISCSKTEEVNPEVKGAKMVPVQISLGLDDDLTRASSALFPEVENWIFDYYYVQYTIYLITIFMHQYLLMYVIMS